MKNPFQYGNVVAGGAFCNRSDELRELRRACDNGEKLFVYSERRLGKTSLVQAVLVRLYQTLWAALGVQRPESVPSAG